MTASALVKKAFISGFCNPANDNASHGRCPGVVADLDCSCDRRGCHNNPIVDDQPCQDCGRPNPVWWTNHDVWNRVMGGPGTTDDPGGLLCPLCFIARAETVLQGVTSWRLSPLRESAP